MTTMSHATNGVSTTTITTSYSSFQQSEGERILGWNVVVIPIFFITLGLLCFSGVISHFRRMNRIRQLQNGVQSIGIVQSSRIEDEQLTVNGVHQYRYYITVEFPVYRLVEDHNDNTTTTATTTWQPLSSVLVATSNTTSPSRIQFSLGQCLGSIRIRILWQGHVSGVLVFKWKWKRCFLATTTSSPATSTSCLGWIWGPIIGLEAEADGIRRSIQ